MNITFIITSVLVIIADIAACIYINKGIDKLDKK